MPLLLFRNNIKNTFINEESFVKIIVTYFVYYIHKVILFSIIHNYADHIYQVRNGPEGYLKTNKTEHGGLDITH